MEIYDCKLLHQTLMRRCEKQLIQAGRVAGGKLRLGILVVTSPEANVAFASRVASLAATLKLDVKDERVAARNVGRKFIPTLKEWSEDKSIHGIMTLYQPEDGLPPLSEIYDILPWDKDTYGEHFRNVGHYSLEEHPHPGYPQPAEAAAVIEIVKHYKIPILKKNVIIIGEGTPFERILMQKLCNMGCEVSFKRAKDAPPGRKGPSSQSGTERVPLINREREIIISCVNKPGFITKSRIAPGSIIIDNGQSFFRGRVGGDVDFNSTQNWARAITPVPGGVKSIAQVITLLNFARLTQMRYGLFDIDKEKDQIQRRFKTAGELRADGDG